MRPRCGREMHAYEGVWGALLDPVTCGRPQGHNGRCRSVQALRRTAERSRKDWPKIREERERLETLRNAQLRKIRQDLLRRQLSEAVEMASRQAWEREMARRRAVSYQ